MKVKVLGKRIVIGLIRGKGPFITIGRYSYSCQGVTDLDQLEYELGFRDTPPVEADVDGGTWRPARRGKR